MTRQILLVMSLALVAAACSDDGPDAATPDPTTTTTTTAASAASVTPPAEAQVVTFPAGDLELEATLYPAGTTWVVLAHMYPADRTSWDSFARRLQAEGYTVLAYDNRGYGGSEGAKEPFDLRADAEAALGHAMGNGASRLVFGGASMNGATAITLGAFYDLAAAFVLSGVPQFDSVSNAPSHLRDLDEPYLFVAAEDDGTSVDDAKDFFDAALSSDLIVLPSGGHGTDMLDAVPDLADRIVQWLHDSL